MIPGGSIFLLHATGSEPDAAKLLKHLNKLQLKLREVRSPEMGARTLPLTEPDPSVLKPINPLSAHLFAKGFQFNRDFTAEDVFR